MKLVLCQGAVSTPCRDDLCEKPKCRKPIGEISQVEYCGRHLCPVCGQHYKMLVFADDQRGCCGACVKISTGDTEPFRPVASPPPPPKVSDPLISEILAFVGPVEEPEPEEEWADRTIANHAREVKYVDASEVPVDGLTGDDVADWTKSGRKDR